MSDPKLQIEKKNWKTFIFQNFYMRPLLLIDILYKYEMDLASIVLDTEQTPLGPQVDRQMDKVKPVYPYPTLLRGV